MMRLTFDDGKDTRRRQRRADQRRRNERDARLINQGGSYDNDEEGLGRAVVKQTREGSNGHQRIERGVLEGTVKRQERATLDLQETLSG